MRGLREVPLGWRIGLPPGEAQAVVSDDRVPKLEGTIILLDRNPNANSSGCTAISSSNCDEEVSVNAVVLVVDDNQEIVGAPSILGATKASIF